MHRVLCLFCLLGMMTTAIAAQDTDKALDGKFLSLSAGVIGSTLFDTETTFRGLTKCSCYEANPVLSPFISAGRPAAYAFETGMDGVALFSAFKLRKMHSKVWWLPATAVVGMHIWLGSRNLQLTRR